MLLPPPLSGPSPLSGLGPLDGRYMTVAEPLRKCFSEHATILYRAMVEAEWLIRVNDIPQLRKMRIGAAERAQVRGIVTELRNPLNVARVKAWERKTRHDVKALEYYMAEELAALGLGELRPLLHFACTSWDINNIAFSVSVQDAIRRAIYPALRDLQSGLVSSAQAWANIPMLARTHGQPASPTTVGKEMAVFAARIAPRLSELEKLAFRRVKMPGKMNGATGNYNAHIVAVPNFDWPKFCQKFVEGFGLRFAPLTTQIEPYDDFADLCNLMRGINNILLDFCRDMWGYVALEYFAQQTTRDEVGSSTMPHKVNPIDFENAEGNLGISSALFAHFSDKLPVSRWQRDLSDSPVLRAVGTAFGHALVAWRSARRGLGKMSPNISKLREDLSANPQVMAEAMQTVMRAEGGVKAYQRLKTRTRRSGHDVDMASVRDLLRGHRNAERRARLSELEPETYVGLADYLVKKHGE